MKRRISLLLSLSLLCFGAACGDDGGGGGSPDATVDDGADAAVNGPEFPALGTQLDRAGRSGVSTALIGTFLDNPTDAATKKNTYSQASDPANWNTFASEIAVNTAIIDSLDATCGNQFLFDAGGSDAYDTLAGALADDVLLINAAHSTCAVYLAVEAGLGGLNFDDCGGRTPVVDTIDRTYSILAIGDVAGVGDGVAADDAVHSDDSFPYLAAPL